MVLTSSVEKNLRSHTQERIRRREPGIVQLSKSYNALCDQLANLIRLGRGLPGCVAPTKISRDGLFRLDVDDDIWQDIGLEEDNGDHNSIPLWLGDDQVREGIRARLELDRCLEEEVRLSKERCSMQEWMMEEWCVAEGANAAASMHFLLVT